MTEVIVKERPILFRPELVNAIFEGRKTQTRRIARDWLAVVAGLTNCPYGQIGDRLWVRETHQIYSNGADAEPTVLYRADGDSAKKWRPSIFMPRWASRLTLEITKVRIERLQDITEADAIAEGIQKRMIQVGRHSNLEPIYPAFSERAGGFHSARAAFEFGWDEINRKRGFGWDKNPILWVIEFRRM